MKHNCLTRFFCLMLLGLMAGGALTFVAKLQATYETRSMISAMEFQNIVINTGTGMSGVIYLMIIAGLSLDLYAQRTRWRSTEFILVLFALLCVLDEGLLTWFGNLPLNRWLPSLDLTLPPLDWVEVQSQWARFMYIRSALLIASFGLLLAATILRKDFQPSQQDVAIVA